MSPGEANEAAEEMGMPYIETSSSLNVNVEEALRKLTEGALKKREKAPGEVKFETENPSKCGLCCWK